MDAVHVGGLGGTYAGSPIGIAAWLAALDVMAREDLCARAVRLGELIRGRLNAIARALPAVGDVRGLGAMQAIELVRDRATREPDAALTMSILEHAAASGLIIISCGAYANVVRLLVPLTIEDELLTEGLDCLATAAMRACSSRHTAAAASASEPSRNGRHAQIRRRPASRHSIEVPRYRRPRLQVRAHQVFRRSVRLMPAPVVW